MYTEINREYIETVIKEEKLWKAGECDYFTFNNWDITLKKESKEYAPFLFTINGINNKTGSSWNRRYTSIEEALLHLFNGFNENANISDRYKSVEHFIVKNFCEEE